MSIKFLKPLNPAPIPSFVNKFGQSPDKYQAIRDLAASYKNGKPGTLKYIDTVMRSVSGIQEEEKDGEITPEQASQDLIKLSAQIKNYIETNGGKSRRNRSKKKKTHRRRR